MADPRAGVEALILLAIGPKAAMTREKQRRSVSERRLSRTHDFGSHPGVRRFESG